LFKEKRVTLIFGTVVALLAGLAFGRRWQAFAIAALAWYVFLATQTVYLIQPGQTGFGGENGLKAVQGALYWLVQPVILALSIGLLFAGAFVHRRVFVWISMRRRRPETTA
jgi:hypothetical protein